MTFKTKLFKYSILIFLIIILLFLSIFIHKNTNISSLVWNKIASLSGLVSTSDKNKNAKEVVLGAINMASFPVDEEALSFDLKTAYTVPNITNPETDFLVFYWGKNRNNNNRRLYVYDSTRTNSETGGLGLWELWSDNQIASLNPAFSDFTPTTGFFVPDRFASAGVAVSASQSSGQGLAVTTGIIPTNFEPKTSYTFNNLIDNKGETYVWGTVDGQPRLFIYNLETKNWSTGTVNSVFASNFVPMVSYVFNNSTIGTGKVNLWGRAGGSLKLYVYDIATATWYDRSNTFTGLIGKKTATPADMPNDFIPMAGYVFNNSSVNDSRINLWGRSGGALKLYIYNFAAADWYDRSNTLVTMINKTSPLPAEFNPSAGFVYNNAIAGSGKINLWGKVGNTNKLFVYDLGNSTWTENPVSLPDGFTISSAFVDSTIWTGGIKLLGKNGSAIKLFSSDNTGATWSDITRQLPIVGDTPVVPTPVPASASASASSGNCSPYPYHIQFWGMTSRGVVKLLVYDPCQGATNGWTDQSAIIGTDGQIPANFWPHLGYAIPASGANSANKIHLWGFPAGSRALKQYVYNNTTKRWAQDFSAIGESDTNLNKVPYDFIPKAGYYLSTYKETSPVVHLWGVRDSDRSMSLMYVYDIASNTWRKDLSMVDANRDVNVAPAYGKIPQFNMKFALQGGYSLLTCQSNGSACWSSNIAQLFGQGNAYTESSGQRTIKPLNFSYDFNQQTWWAYPEHIKVTSQGSAVTIKRFEPFTVSFKHYIPVYNYLPGNYSVWLKNNSKQFLIASNINAEAVGEMSPDGYKSYSEKIRVDDYEEKNESAFQVDVGTYNVVVCASGDTFTGSACGTSLGQVTLTEDPRNINFSKNILFSITDKGAEVSPRFDFGAPTSTKPDTWANTFEDEAGDLPARRERENEPFYAVLSASVGSPALFTKVYQKPVIFMTPGPNCFINGVIRDIPECVGPWPDDLEMPCYKDANILTLKNAQGVTVGSVTGFKSLCQ